MATQSVKQSFFDDLEAELGIAEGSDRPDDAARLAEAIVEWAKPLFDPARYKCLYGGRGSGKSYAIADALLITGLGRKIRVLCAREFQESMKESVHALLKERIAELDLEDFYRVQADTIIGKNGSQFIFKGVRHNVASIKSMAGITHCWFEEAQTISQDSWRVVIPTIREEGSEVWVSFNPLNESDTVYQELVAKDRANAYIRRVNWDENPHFPSVLDAERREMAETDPDAYQHIWEGGFWLRSNAQVLNGKWAIADFEPEPDWDGPYHGADWGFATDPTTAIRCWINGRKLYIERESYAHGLELDEVGRLWAADIPGIQSGIPVRADSARPDTIKHVRRGRPASENDPGAQPIPGLVGATKGPNSVEEGIAHLRSYEKIIIHPRCKHMAEEARLYSYKVDRLSGDVLPIIIDANNHLHDSLRYALEPIMRSRAGKAQKSGIKFA